LPKTGENYGILGEMWFFSDFFLDKFAFGHIIRLVY